MIVECVRSRLPVFIYIPTDVVGILVEAQSLSKPLDTTVRNSDSAAESLVVEKILTALKNATRPAILADVLAIRHGGQNLTRKLVDGTHFQIYATPMSKGIINEDSPYYNGIYNGEGIMSRSTFTRKQSDTGPHSILPRHQKRS
jgi:pyruvate decarboxylase